MNRIDEILARMYQSIGISKDSQFCEKYDIKANTLSTWKKREKIPYELIEEISQNENLSLDWLLTGKGNMLLEDKKYLPSIPNTALSTDVVSINFYPDVYAAAGYGAINGNAVVETMVFDRMFLELFLNVRKFDKLDIIHIEGDSMEPYIHNGEYVIIERNHEAKNGETVIANIDGEIYVKRFHSIPFQKWVRLISENKIYDDIIIDTLEKLELFTIVGIVRAKIKPF